MKCLHCPVGEAVPGTKTASLERHDTLLVLRHVPADVCDTCGAAVYRADVTDRLRELLDEAVQAGAQVLVKEFAFAEDHDGAEESARGRVGAPGR